MRRLSASLALLLMLAGCTSPPERSPPNAEEVYQRLVLSKVGAEESMKVSIRQHRDDIMGETQYRQAEVAYQQWFSVQSVAVAVAQTQYPGAMLDWGHVMPRALAVLQAEVTAETPAAVHP